MEAFRWVPFALSVVFLVFQLGCVALWKPWQQEELLPRLTILTALVVTAAMAILELNAAWRMSDAICVVLLVGLRYVAVPRIFLLSILQGLRLRKKGRHGEEEPSEKPYLAVSLAAAIVGAVLGLTLRFEKVSETGDCVIIDLGSYFYVGILAVAFLAAILWNLVARDVSLEEKAMLRMVAATWLCFGSFYFVLLGVLEGIGASAEAKSGGLHLLWTVMMTFLVCVISAPRMKYTRVLATWRMRKISKDATTSNSDLEMGETQSSGASSDWTQTLSAIGGRRASVSSAASEETADYRFSPQLERFDVANPSYGMSLDYAPQSESHLFSQEESKASGSPRMHAGQSKKKQKRASLSNAQEGNPPMIVVQRRPRSVPGGAVTGGDDDDGKTSQQSYSVTSSDSATRGNPLRLLSSRLSKLFNPVQQQKEVRMRKTGPLEPNSPGTEVDDDLSEAQGSVETVEMHHDQSWELGTRDRRSLSNLTMTTSVMRLGFDEIKPEQQHEIRSSEASPNLLRQSPRTAVVTEGDRGQCIRVAVGGGGGRRVSSGTFSTPSRPERSISVSMEDIFDSTALLSVLLDLAEKRMCTELVRFCQAARLYKTLTFTDPKPQHDSCRAILRTFLDEGTEDEINLSNRTKLDIRRAVGSLESFMVLESTERMSIFDAAFNEMKDLLFHNLVDELRNSPEFVAVVSKMQGRLHNNTPDSASRRMDTESNGGKQRMTRASFFPTTSISLGGFPGKPMPRSTAWYRATVSSAADDSTREEAELHRTVLERIEESFRLSQESPCGDYSPPEHA